MFLKRGSLLIWLSAAMILVLLSAASSTRAQSAGPQAVPNATLIPSSKLVGSGAFYLTVRGENFTKGDVITWQDQPLATRFLSATKLRGLVPRDFLAAAGLYTIQVIHPADGSAIGTQTFTVAYPRPHLSYLRPAEVKIYGPDFDLTLYGTGFVDGVSHAHWNGVEVASSVISKTRMRVRVTAEMVGTTAGLMEVRVTNPGPGGGTAQRMLRVRNPAPLVTSLEPAAIPAGAGDTVVTLNGSRFVPTSVVRLNGKPLATTFVDAGRLTAVIPAAELASERRAALSVRTPLPGGGVSRSLVLTVSAPAKADRYVLLGWNDLGMHCYNRDFADLAVLPPYNTLVAQVIRLGNPPKIVTQGITVSYRFPDNTYSVGKSNFWSYAQKLFGLDRPLPENIGLTGRGLAGDMTASGDHFIADGIPLTEYNDNDHNQRYPFQKAELVAKDNAGNILATLTVVAPVSTEMTCNNCHSDGQREGIATGKVETNILALHDKENADEYPAGFSGKLMDAANRPVLCANCHASNALGAPGKPGIPSLSKAMHSKHAGEVPDTLDGCYQCHPGPETKCLRDVMSREEGMDCIDCHGGLAKVATNPNPWLNEPRCDNCHDGVKQNNALYRLSTGHGGVFCEACHDSTHAIAKSSQPNDAIKFQQLQGKDGPLEKCTVCHLNSPGGDNPHVGD